MSPKRRSAGHESQNWPARVFAWDVPNIGGRKAWRPPQEVIDQLRLAHDLACRMVEISWARDAAFDAVYLTFPAAAEARAEVDRAEQDVETALEVVKARCARERKRDIEGPEVDRLTETKRVARKARLAQREIRQGLKDSVKPGLKRVDRDYLAAIKSAYQEFSVKGLYWATINAVQAESIAADGRVISTRAEGRPAVRRMPRPNGSGVLAVSLQRAAGKPRRSPELLTDRANIWRNVLRLPSEPGRKIVGFGLGSYLPMADIPVIVDRLPPPEADITGAKLVARRIAARVEWSLCVTAKIPPAPKRTRGARVAIHLGWRKESDGRIRVLTWRATKDLQVPPKLYDIVEQDTPRSGRVLIPNGILWRLETAADVQSGRAQELLKIKGQLAEWLDVNPQATEDGSDAITGETVRQWLKVGRFARLALQWRERKPKGEGAIEIAAALENWRRWDKLRAEAQAHGDRRGRRARRQVIQRFAAWLTEESREVVIDGMDMAVIQSRSKRDTVNPSAATQRQRAAAGEARLIIVRTCDREGVAKSVVKQSGLTLTHHACGYKNLADERWAASAMVVCDGCGRAFDQDANYATGLLREKS